MYAAEMPSCDMTFLPSFMNTGTGVEGILRCFLSNLKGCDVAVTDGRDL
jgi:hypothetical protein